MADYDWGWLIGMLEGEGTFGGRMNKRRRPRGGDIVKEYPSAYIQIGSTDPDTIKRVEALIPDGSTSIDAQRPRATKPLYRWRLQRSDRALTLMAEAHPFMSERRQAQIEKVQRMMNACV